MEGPSLVIARDEMSPAIRQKVLHVHGNSRLPIQSLKGQTLQEIGTWGKHLLLFFSDCTVKIHFLLWGSYRVDDPKPQKPRLELDFKNLKIYCYSCSVQFLEKDADEIYDWSADVMSPAWDPNKALAKLQKMPKEMVCDVLMDQSIFSGVGNIIKNETLFLRHLHPEHKVGDLSPKQQKALIDEADDYTWKFYYWKKKFELKKHWLIMRKKTCPQCGGPVRHQATGHRHRLSHFCPHCQK